MLLKGVELNNTNLLTDAAQQSNLIQQGDLAQQANAAVLNDTAQLNDAAQSADTAQLNSTARRVSAIGEAGIGSAATRATQLAQGNRITLGFVLTGVIFAVLALMVIGLIAAKPALLIIAGSVLVAASLIGVYVGVNLKAKELI